MLRDDLVEWLKTELKPLLVTETLFYFGDMRYYLPTKPDITGAWAGSGLDVLISTPQRFDCDDFAFAFKGHCSRFAYVRGDWSLCGLCLGFVSGLFGWRSGRHAANLVVNYADGTPEVNFIEPSTGRFHALTEGVKICNLFI